MPETERTAATPSLAKTSAVRLTAQASGVLFGSVSSIVAARSLGPAGKGILSTLLFVSHEFVFYVAAFGLGDAVMILRGRREATLSSAVGASLPFLLFSSTIGVILVFGISFVVLHEEWTSIRTAVLVAAAVLPAWVFFDFFVHVLNSEEAIPFTSAVIVGSTAISAAGLVLALPVLHTGITGAVVGAGIGPVLAAGFCVVRVRRTTSLRPRIDPDYLRAALRYGLPILGSYLLLALSQRVDQILVFSIAGKEAAGLYSVALTVGLVTTHGAMALSLASFPRLTRMAEPEAVQLTARICRTGIAAAIVTSAILVAVSPFLIPKLFGPGFRPSVAPTLILLGAGIFWSAQWLMARAQAARGGTHLLFFSFSTNVAVLVVADIFLIPRMGIAGAAVAALLGTGAGTLVCLVSLTGSTGGFRVLDLVPGPRDFRSLAVEVTDLARKSKARLRSRGSGARHDE